MFINETLWLDSGLILALGISLLSMLLAFSCSWRLRKQARVLNSLQQRLQHNLSLANNSSMGMGRKLLQLERQLQEADALPQTAVADTAEQRPVAAAAAAVDDSLVDAASLLAAGVSAEEVARRCGISRAEASLMKLMHAQVHRATAA